MSKFKKISGDKIQRVVFKHDLIKVMKNETGEEMYVRLRDLVSFLEGNENIDWVFIDENGSNESPPELASRTTAVAVYKNGYVWRFSPSSGWEYQGQIEQGSSNEYSTVFIDYNNSVVVNAVWSFGNLLKRVSTEATTVAHNGIQKWHFSPIDIHDASLDSPTVSFFNELIEASQAANVIFKVYNRIDPSQYVVLVTKEPIIKSNPNVSMTQYDIECLMEVVAYNNVFDNSIQNPTVDIKIGSSKEVVRYDTDVFTSFAVIKNVVTLSQAEYDALPTPRPQNTLYLTPCNL